MFLIINGVGVGVGVIILISAGGILRMIVGFGVGVTVGVIVGVTVGEPEGTSVGVSVPVGVAIAAFDAGAGVILVAFAVICLLIRRAPAT